MTLQELNKYAGRKREFSKEANSISKKNNPFILDENNSNPKENIPEPYELKYNNVQQNLKFANTLDKKIKAFTNSNSLNENKKNKISEINKSYLNLNSKDFARNIKFKSIYSVTSTKKNKNKNKNKKTKTKTKKMISRKNKDKNSSFDKDFTDLPKNFKRWANFMSPVRNQGKCGSCYAVSTLNMLESRLKIKTGITEELSLDHVLNCSVYNQGCEGGYSYLVLKFAKEIELIPKRCEKINDEKVQCGVKKCKNSFDGNNITSYKVKNFGYLGGSYGKCNEELLMRELQKNGPVVVSFEPDYHFMMYKKGIYKSLQSNWMSKNLQKPEWEKVDHSVTLVGWGYDEVHEKKYWLLLNSWGKHWGENGYFRMLRGEDHNGIESICEIGEIVPEIL
jgi:cathepsin C